MYIHHWWLPLCHRLLLFQGEQLCLDPPLLYPCKRNKYYCILILHFRIIINVISKVFIMKNHDMHFILLLVDDLLYENTWLCWHRHIARCIQMHKTWKLYSRQFSDKKALRESNIRLTKIGKLYILIVYMYRYS